jgi:hypothetical protein
MGSLRILVSVRRKKMEIKNIIPAEKGWKAVFDDGDEYTLGVAVLCWALVDMLSETSETATATRVPVRFSHTEVHGLIVGASGTIEDAEKATASGKPFQRYDYS